MDDLSTPPESSGAARLRPDRRKVLLAGAATGAAVWVAPSILSVDAARAATVEPLEPAPGMAVWFSAGVGVTEADGAVSGWADQSSVPKNATVPPLASAPVLEMTGINGLPAIAFNGSDQSLEVPITLSPAVSGSEYATVFAVFRSNTANAENHKVYSNDAGFDRAAGLDPRPQDANPSAGNYGYFADLPNPNWVGSYFDLAAGIDYLTVDQWTPTTFTGTVNGTEEVSAQPVNTNGGWGASYIGALNSVGAEPWDGLIAEVIIYLGSSAMAPADVAQTQTYLLTKYGLL